MNSIPVNICLRIEELDFHNPDHELENYVALLSGASALLSFIVAKIDLQLVHHLTSDL